MSEIEQVGRRRPWSDVVVGICIGTLTAIGIAALAALLALSFGRAPLGDCTTTTSHAPLRGCP